MAVGEQQNSSVFLLFVRFYEDAILNRSLSRIGDDGGARDRNGLLEADELEK
jgi:hypothetical protein